MGFNKNSHHFNFSLCLCITKCTISVKANLETVIVVMYLQFTIETQGSFKRKLRTLILQKILCHSIKGTGLVSKYWLRLVSNNKSGAFFISFYFFSAFMLRWLCSWCFLFPLYLAVSSFIF